nr:MAG: putative RNA-dependent RNA polymerase [Botourmiaviridae sp.]
MEEYNLDIIAMRNFIPQLAGIVARRQKTRGCMDLERILEETFGLPYFGPRDLASRLDLSVKAASDYLPSFTPTEKLVDWFVLSFDRAVTLSAGYRECLSFFDFVLSRKENRALIAKLFAFGLAGLMEEYAKFESAYLLAKVLGSDTPPRPEYMQWNHIDGTLFSGGTHRRIWMRLGLRRRQQDVSLALSLYKVKEVAERLLPYQVEAKMEENLRVLTVPRCDPQGSDDDLAELEVQVRRTVREVHHLARRNGFSRKVRSCLPSIHASYRLSRSRGGAFTELLGSDDPLVGLSRTFVGYCELRTRVCPVYLPSDPYLVESYLMGLSRECEMLPTRRSPILEPFKVRVVSSGPAREYHICRMHQRSLWEMLSKVECCRLVGSPFRSEDVEDCFRIPRSTGIHSYLISGDYKSATDNLDPNLSNVALDEYCRLTHVPFEDHLLMQRALTGHKVDGEKPQRWGQLMGSPVSFPILCLVNLAVTRFVMERQYEMFIPLDWSPLRVNGDDILFPLPSGGYDDWVYWVTLAGLTPSVGKNYFSREYCMINSKMYRLPKDWDRRDCVDKPILVPQINLGLIRGPSGPGRQTLSEWIAEPENPWSPYNLGDSMREALRGWSEPKLVARIEKACIRHAMPFLETLPPVSWFTSTDLGGLGLPSSRPKILEHHLRISAFISSDSFTKDHEMVMRTKWLGSPSCCFSKAALMEVTKLSIAVGAVWTRRARTDLVFPGTSSKLTGIVRFGMSLLGPDIELVDERAFRKLWFQNYQKLRRSAERASSFLRPMAVEKAVEPLPFVWELEEARW